MGRGWALSEAVQQPGGWPQGARRPSGKGHTGGRGSTGASVATVFPALVQLTLVACVAGLAAALGLPACIEEAAATIEALKVAGSRPSRCRREPSGGKSGTRGEEWVTRGPGEEGRRGEHTIWRGCRRGHRYTGAIVQPLAIGTGADRPTGAQQAEPLTLLAVTGVGHCR